MVGEVKDPQGRVIERHIVNFKALGSQEYPPKKDRNMLGELVSKKNADDRRTQEKSRPTKGLGMEFHSFSYIRSMVQEEKDHLRA